MCVRLGLWQLDRLAERRAFNERLEQAMASEAVALDELPDGATYRRVAVVGTYDAANEVILYGRSIEGRPGHHVLTPLTLDDGRAVIVDRGWVPFDEDRPPVGGEAAAPTADVRVEGVVLPSEDGDAVDPSATQVRTIDVDALDERTPATLVPGRYVLLERQDPPQERPVVVPLPEPTEGPHLGYAVQWFAFAAIALVGYVLLVRRDRRSVRPADGPRGLGGS